LEIRVISGDEEAAYSFLAVERGLGLAGRELLVVDVGGGSTEFIRGNAAGVLAAVSIDVGSVRLTERYVHSDPVQPAEVERMYAAIDDALDGLQARGIRAQGSLTMVGLAGPVPPGESAYAVTDLEAGDYIAVCFIPVGTVSLDGPPPEGPPHVMQGMQHQFTVS